MFGRGRGGPSRATPANVQCQKCLKRDMFPPPVPGRCQNAQLTVPARHYSYECKASAQERPYVSRPSRTQQLRNPKLQPKLDSDKPKPLENKKGIADEELAKREAEGARLEDYSLQLDRLRAEDMTRRQIAAEYEARRERDRAATSKRPRSPSVDSVSTVSSSSSHSRSRSQSRSRSPPRRGRDRPASESDGEVHESRSASPARRRTRQHSPDARSRSPARHHHSYRSREPVSPIDDEADRMPRRRRRYSGTSAASRDSRPRHRHLSRSPDANRRSVDPPPAAAPRERSLSPFSRRLALTRGER